MSCQLKREPLLYLSFDHMIELLSRTVSRINLILILHIPDLENAWIAGSNPAPVTNYTCDVGWKTHSCVPIAGRR